MLLCQASKPFWYIQLRNHISSFQSLWSLFSYVFTKWKGGGLGRESLSAVGIEARLQSICLSAILSSPANLWQMCQA